MYSPLQKLYIDSVSGASHTSAVVMLGKADADIARLKEALEKIRDMDYRGNAHPSHYIAKEALTPNAGIQPAERSEDRLE